MKIKNICFNKKIKNKAAQYTAWFSLYWFLLRQSLSLAKCDKGRGNFDKSTNFAAAQPCDEAQLDF